MCPIGHYDVITHKPVISQLLFQGTSSWPEAVGGPVRLAVKLALEFTANRKVEKYFAKVEMFYVIEPYPFSKPGAILVRSAVSAFKSPSQLNILDHCRRPSKTERWERSLDP